MSGSLLEGRRILPTENSQKRSAFGNLSRAISLAGSIGLQGIACLLLTASPIFADPIDTLRDNLPVTDWLPAAQTIIYGLDKTIEAVPLFAQSVLRQDPSVTQGLASDTAVGSSGEDELQVVERTFHDGQGIGNIAVQMVEDFVDNISDFYGGEAEWGITGLCYKKTSIALMQEYFIPVMWGEINSDPLRGQYMEKDIIRPLFKELLRDGPMLPLLTSQFETPGDLFDIADIIAPYDINRAMQITKPRSNGEQPDSIARIVDQVSEIAQQGGIPDTPSQNSAFHSNETAYLRGETNQHHRNVEAYRFSGLANLTGIPMAFLGNCHYSYTAETTLPFIHRTDNPVYFPFARSPSLMDTLMLINGKVDKLLVASTPGACVAYDLLSLKGLTGALGFWPGETRFGMLAEVNPGIAGVLTLTNATDANCLKSGGALYPLTNRIRGNKYFQAHFYNRLLRFDIQSNMVSMDGLPSFQVKNSGVNEASKIQLHRSSWGGSHDPTELTDALWDDPFSSPFSYSQKRQGNAMDIGVFSEWHYMDCCPHGYDVLSGDEPQIKGQERYTQDGWN